MSTLKRILVILAAALLVVGLTAGAMNLTSASSSTQSGQQVDGSRPAGGPDGGGRDEAGGFGALELLKNLMITGGIVAVVAALSLGIDKLSKHGRPEQPALPS